MTFTGSAFRVPPRATSVLVFQDGARLFAPGPSGPDLTGPSTSIAGLNQGAVLEVGKGRLVLNLTHWLSIRINARDAPEA